MCIRFAFHEIHICAVAQERLEDHRRQEASRALVVCEREAVRSAVLAALQTRLAGVKGLLPVLRTLQVPVEGEPAPTQAQILKCAHQCLPLHKCSGIKGRTSPSCVPEYLVFGLLQFKSHTKI